MTRAEIISMARGADPFGDAGRLFAMAEITPETLERFAALVAAAERTAMARHFDVSLRNAVKAEREACAKGCETSVAGLGSETEWADGYIQAAKDIAAGIRARGDFNAP